MIKEGIITWPWSLWSPSIPIMSVNLTADPEHYLLRLLRSIDHKIDSIIIVIGNENENIVKSILDDINLIKDERKDLTIETVNANINPGCAHGMNIGLQRIHFSTKGKWGFLVNNDIAFYPGMLARFANAVEHAIHDDSKFGIAFPSLCCGGQWSAFAITKSLISAIGYIDENIYPMFYEDNDYSVRIHLSGYHAKKFKYVPLMHGRYNGRLKYVSGTMDALKVLEAADHSKAVTLWRAQIQRGKYSSENYLVEKWGFHGQPRYYGCKTVLEMHHSCNASYTHPFNNSAMNISYWSFQPARREWILHGVEPKPFTVYDIEREKEEEVQ